MALNRNGRVLYLDASGTYNAIFPAGTPVRLDEVRLIGGSDAATLTLYAAATAVAGTEIAILKTALANEVDDFVIASDETKVPDCYWSGFTAVLSGTSAKAFIWLA